MSKQGLSIKEIMENIDNIDNISEQQKTEAKIKTFYKFIKWSENDYKDYEILLNKLKSIKGRSKVKTKDIGSALENLVNFIFEKSFFYKVYKNKRTSTNEIDQFVLISDRGYQALQDYNFSRELLISNENYFLCECKNYKDTVASTWVGKFNTLLETCGNMNTGIIFSYKGLTGKENNWCDAHGLTKIIYRITSNANPRFILDFNINDFEKLLDRNENIYSIIKRKKDSLIGNINSTSISNETHDGLNEISNIFIELCDLNM